MKKIIIKNKQGVIGWGAEMLDPSQWIAECIANDVWGKPERPELDADGNPTGIMLPAEYTVEIEDITDKLEQERINAEALAYLASTDWIVLKSIDTGMPYPEDVKLARAEARAKIVRSV